MATGAALEIRGLRKRFGAVEALAGVDLTVEHGEVVALLGPNGAGKSTLLRIVAGSVSLDVGTVTIQGFDVDRSGNQARAQVGWVMGDEHSWYWRLSGRKNLELFGRMRGMLAADARSSSDRLLDELALADAADLPVAGYSTGMKARLALARGRLGDPSVLLLDEPSRGLDTFAEEQFTGWLQDQTSAAVILVTHTLEEASAVADRIIVLSHGRIASELEPGTSAALIDETLRRSP